MKKFILFTFGIIAAIAIFTGCAQENVFRLIKVNSFQGTVTVQRKEKINAFKGLQLISKDRVEVESNSHLELLADSDKHIVAEENTAFTLKATGTEQSGNITVDLLYGKALFTIENKLNEGSSFEVNTPNAALSVRGTIFYVEYDPETNTTRVTVKEGVVAVVTAEETEELTAGETATISDSRIETGTKSEQTETPEKNEPSTDRDDFYNDEGELLYYYISEYDSDGNKIKYSHFGGDDSLRFIWTYEYDSDGNKIKYSMYGEDGNLKEFFTYEYDSNGNQIRHNCYDPDGTLTSYYIYEYDSDGNKINQEHIQLE